MHRNKDKRVTMRDIAEEAGVTPATVSMALKNKPCISGATRKKVQQIADQLGYRQDPLLAQLMATRRQGKSVSVKPHIAWLTQFDTEDSWKTKSSTLDKMYKGAEIRAEERGYALEPFWLKAPGMTPQRMKQILLTRDIHAIILPAQPVMNMEMDFPFEPFCVVAIGNSITNPGLNRVQPDLSRGVKFMLKAAEKKGLRRIGLVIKNDDYAHLNDPLYAETLLFWANHADFPAIPPYRYQNRMGQNLSEWIRKHRPDVLFSVNANLDVLNDPEVLDPKALPLCMFLNHYDMKERKLTGVDIQPDLVGARAVDLMVSMIQQNQRGLLKEPYKVVTPTSWYEKNP
ncbi:MAG: LacI family DNA-binding transcriptional regulator [Kiritimatiellae bacterium]|jgi:DNA-binding LacI/PurR family transcriptional regulator|nr:LacI family DNA-binding transcriptional regulator [Kiritimatiellia bacterium]